MPATAKLENLIDLNQEILKLKNKFPEACDDIAELIKRNRYIGYRNFCKLFTGEWTPEELKKGEKDKAKKEW
ncbi:hypothetical protein ACFLRX_08220 [Acidobacteriota bacterium]